MAFFFSYNIMFYLVQVEIKSRSSSLYKNNTEILKTLYEMAIYENKTCHIVIFKQCLTVGLLFFSCF